MAEYIEREALIQFVNQNICHFNGETTLKCVEICLKAAPTADVADSCPYENQSECKYFESEDGEEP